MEVKVYGIAVEIHVDQIAFHVMEKFAGSVLKELSQWVQCVQLIVQWVQSLLMEFVFAQVDSFITTTVLCHALLELWPLVLGVFHLVLKELTFNLVQACAKNVTQVAKFVVVLEAVLLVWMKL